MLIVPVCYWLFLHFMSIYRGSHSAWQSRSTNHDFLTAMKWFMCALVLDTLATIFVAFGRGRSRIILVALGLVANVYITISL